MTFPLTRRRFLSISAAAASLATSLVATPVQASDVARWRGQALGAHASMTLDGLGDSEAQPIFGAVEQELTRLEAIFSLYRDDSEISRLNQSGQLVAPSAELLDVLSLSGALFAATDGAFDPTVQPLWLALAQGGDVAAKAVAKAVVGWQNVQFDTTAVRLTRPGMGLTLNGIAQGYITDRIAALLRRRGLNNVLIDMGEIAALGGHGDGRDWQAGIARPDGVVVHRVSLRDRALATSAPLGTVMPQNGGFGHIVDPSGAAAASQNLVSISAPLAAVADGLSTACCLLDKDQARAAVSAFPGAAIEWLA